jgi:hypothetical protein
MDYLIKNLLFKHWHTIYTCTKCKKNNWNKKL